MRIRNIAVATAALAACLATPTNISAQLTAVTDLHVTTVVNPTGDVTTSMLTAAIPNLAVSSGTGSLTVILRDVAVEPQNRVSLSPSVRSSEWITIQVGAAPAGAIAAVRRYHVGFNFTNTTTSQLSIHVGQNTSDPVAARCTVTASLPRCDILLTAPPSGLVYLAAVVDSGSGLDFKNVILAQHK